MRETERAQSDFRFACLCCRAGLEPDGGARDLPIHPSAATPSAIRRVLRERVGGLACRGLSARGALAALPGAARESLLAAYASATRQHEFRRDAVRRIAPALARNGVPYRLMRGTALALRLYGDPGLRPSLDEDILVPPAQWNAARETLGALGFRESGRFPGSFRRGPVRVDLHSSLGNLGRIGARRHLYGELERSAWAPPGTDAEGLHVLPPAVDFLHLACHALKHACGHLVWVADLAAWIRTFGPAGLEEASRLASRTGLTWPVVWALRIVRDALGIDVALPRGRRDALCGGAVVNRLLARIARGDRPSWAGPLLVSLAAGSFPRALAVLWGSAFPRAEVLAQLHPGRSTAGAYAARSLDMARRVFATAGRAQPRL